MDGGVFIVGKLLSRRSILVPLSSTVPYVRTHLIGVCNTSFSEYIAFEYNHYWILTEQPFCDVC